MGDDLFHRLYGSDRRRRRRGSRTGAFEPCIRAGTRITLMSSRSRSGSLSLVALEPVWSRVLVSILSVPLIVANVETVSRSARPRASPLDPLARERDRDDPAAADADRPAVRSAASIPIGRT